MSQKKCQKCECAFLVTDADKSFYSKLDVPEPTRCPDCRQKRRLAWRNERNLFRRKCDLCNKDMLSIYDQDCDYKVYCLDCWWSDKWNAQNYAREFDFERPFFEQFAELQNEVPHMALLQDKNENSEYTNYVSNLKDCYLLFSSDFNRDCYYGVWTMNSQNCADNLMIDGCELSYECIFSNKIYNGVYVLNSSNCIDSSFLYDCKNCTNCFMCYGLRNKEYCIFNKQFSKEEYFKHLEEYNLSSYRNFETFKNQFKENIKKAKYLHLRRNGRVINSTGDFLTNVENCKNCYELISAKDCRYVQGGFEVKDAMDCCYVNGEFGYENCECFPMPFKSCFNLNCYKGNDLYYSDSCMNNNKYLFGCVSMRQSEYCILNKQYSKEEYQEMLPKIIEHMKKTTAIAGQAGEFGEFFPIQYSPFMYNLTNAQEYFPEKDEISEQKVCDLSQIPQIEDDIADIDDSILKETLSCHDCCKNYKIIKPEFEFYKNKKLPIPRQCFECRHLKRAEFRNYRKLFNRVCQKCHVGIKSTYSPEQVKEVYCEKCYLEDVV